MQVSSSTLLVLCLMLALVTSAWADATSDAKKRAAEIDKAIAQSEQMIENFSRISAVRNASLIQREQAKIEELKEERAKLTPGLKKAYANKLEKRLAEQIVESEQVLASALLELRYITTGSSKSAANTSEQRDLKQAQQGYLAAITQSMLIGDESTQRARIAKVRSEASGKFEILQKTAVKVAHVTKESSSNSKRIEARADVEAKYRAARLRQEAAMMATLTLDRGKGEWSTVGRMRELMEAIATNDPKNYLAPRDGNDASAHIWFRQLKREIDLEEYRRYAAHGPVFDEGQLVTGKNRQEIAFYAELGLAERVKAASNTMPISSLFWPADSRPVLAEEIKREAMSNPDHVIFAYLQTGVEPSPRMYMFAVMRALRFEQQKINDWMVNAYSQSWYNTGLGTLIRASDGLGTGEAGFTEVKRRIQVYMREVDAVHEAFKRATETPKPEDLSQDDQDLLSAFGYVSKGLDGGLEYKVPKEGNLRGLTAGAQRGLKLPGAPILDVVTPKNVAVTVVSTVVPGGFATMVEGMALRAGAGAYTIMGVKMIAEMGMGMAIDSTVQYAETGKVDMEAIFLDSILLGGALEGVNRGTGRVAKEMAEKLSKYEADSILGNILKSKAVQKNAATWIEESLGLASEAAITALYEEKFKGNDVDFNIFLSNLVNSTMTRWVSTKYSRLAEGEFISHEEYNKKIQESMSWLWEFVKSDPAITRQMHEISAEQYKLQQGAKERFEKAVGEGEPVASRLYEALLKGEISWLDLTIVYQAKTKKMEGLMYEIKDLRDGFFDEIQVDAVRLARKELLEEFGKKLQKIDAMDVSASERKRLADEAYAEYEHDARYMAEQIIAPGSKSPVSDIDRSMQHPKLRRLMEHMFEVRARKGNDGTYIPTSARAFDVNEYYNVMPFISDTNQLRHMIDPLPVGGDLTHGDIMESYGYAAAMMHMNFYQKSKYKRNETKHLKARLKKKGIAEDSAQWKKAIDRFETLYDIAETDLAKGKRELYAKMEEMGLDKNVAENEIRARSALYQERIQKYYEKLKKLDGVWEGNDNAAKHELRAEIEREMAFFLREGIETYSGSSTLDIVVIQMQIAGLKPEKALVDPTFNLMGELSNLRPEDIDFMVRDQCLMMVEHINGYYDGHELPYNSGKALAKYAQRALLAMKIKGDVDIKAAIAKNDPNDPVLKLHRMTEELMAQKPNPKAFEEILSSFTSEKNPDAGLKKLMEVIEQVIPGMEGMADVDNFQHLSSVKVGMTNPYKTRGHFQYVRIARKREEAVLAKRISELGGGRAYKQYILSQKEEAEQTLAEVRERLEMMKVLATEYEPKDWAEVMRLKKAIKGCELVGSNTPYRSPKFTENIEKPKLKMYERLRELMLPKEMQTPPSGYSLYTRLWLQTQHLMVSIAEKDLQLIEAEKQIAHEAMYDGMDLSGVWVFEHGSYRGRAKIEQHGQFVKMWLSVDAMSAKPPHFYIEGRFVRGQLRAVWEELHSEKLKVNATAKDWNERGRLFADVDQQKSVISITKQSIELADRQEGGWLWAGLTLKPAPEGTRAPTNLKILTVEKSRIAQKKKSEYKPREPRRKQGNIYIEQYTADGSPARRNFALYTPGTYGTAKEDKIAHVYANSEESLVPGTYELVRKRGDQVERTEVTITEGGTTRVELPAMGSLRFKPLDERGKEFSEDRIQLRLFVGKKPIGWVGYTPAQLDPGSYEIVIYYDNSPIGEGESYRRTIEISERQETLVQARYGALKMSLLDIDGKEAGKDAYVSSVFINPDGSNGATLSAESVDKILLLPGKYRISCRLQNGNTLSKEISVVPAEVLKEEVKLGRLRIQNHGELLRQDSGIRVMLTAVGGKVSYVNVSDFSKIDLFPGLYEAMLIDSTGKSASKKIKVTAKRTVTLSFNL